MSPDFFVTYFPDRTLEMRQQKLLDIPNDASYILRGQLLPIGVHDIEKK